MDQRSNGPRLLTATLTESHYEATILEWRSCYHNMQEVCRSFECLVVAREQPGTGYALLDADGSVADARLAAADAVLQDTESLLEVA